MNGRWIFSNPRRRLYRSALVVTSVISFVAIAAVATGCGSPKKSISIASNPGTGIAYVEVLPSKQILRQGTTMTIVLKRNLSFVVGVKNGGGYPEQNVEVTLVIHQTAPASPITKTLTIPKISNGAIQELAFKGPFDIRTMISVVPITVDVHPVPGESNTVDNKATYNVRFSF